MTCWWAITVALTVTLWRKPNCKVINSQDCLTHSCWFFFSFFKINSRVRFAIGEGSDIQWWHFSLIYFIQWRQVWACMQRRKRVNCWESSISPLLLFISCAVFSSCKLRLLWHHRDRINFLSVFWCLIAVSFDCFFLSLQSLSCSRCDDFTLFKIGRHRWYFNKHTPLL